MAARRYSQLPAVVPWRHVMAACRINVRQARFSAVEECLRNEQSRNTMAAQSARTLRSRSREGGNGSIEGEMVMSHAAGRDE